MGSVSLIGGVVLPPLANRCSTVPGNPANAMKSYIYTTLASQGIELSSIGTGVWWLEPFDH